MQLVAVAVALLVIPGPATAQGLWERMESPAQLRAEFLAYFAPHVRVLLTDLGEAWQNDQEDILDLYTSEAVVTVPGEASRRRGEGLEEYLHVLLSAVSGIQLGMRTMDASDELGFIFGRYTLNGIAGPDGLRRDQGDHITLVAKEDKEWRIRHQLLVSEQAGEPRLWWEGDPAQPLGAYRLAPPQRRPRLRDLARQRVLSGVSDTYFLIHQAWAAGDLEATRGLLTENVVFRAPTGQVQEGKGQVLDLLAGGTVGFAEPLFTVPVDFDAGGRMAFLSGRFSLDIPGVPVGITSTTVS